jgi:hypothetical protein
VILFSTIVIQQKVYAQGLSGCDVCGEFRSLTWSFVKNVVSEVLQSSPDPDKQQKLAQFRQLSGQFQIDVINALSSNPPAHDKIPEFDKVYTDGVLRILLGGPDTIPGLLDACSQGVKEIFGLGPC